MSDCLSNCNLPGSSVRGLSRQEHWSGLPFPSPGGLPDPGTEPASLASPALAGGFFTISCISCIGRWILYHLLHLLCWQVDSLPRATCGIPFLLAESAHFASCPPSFSIFQVIKIEPVFSPRSFWCCPFRSLIHTFWFSCTG